jgi:hypothetical protein
VLIVDVQHGRGDPRRLDQEGDPRRVIVDRYALVTHYVVVVHRMAPDTVIAGDHDRSPLVQTLVLELLDELPNQIIEVFSPADSAR